MKVAISAQGNDIDALVDPRFGRARWLIVADSETGEWQAHDNSVNVDASGGAGVQAGSTVAAQGPQAVITGNVGPNAHKVLAAAGITIYQAGNGVRVHDALAALGRGELAKIDAPTVSGHWA
jgi:predicted Fe-Mo cluster-binding NifX family protein